MNANIPNKNVIFIMILQHNLSKPSSEPDGRI